MTLINEYLDNPLFKEILNEVRKEKLIANTDAGRKFRSKMHVRTRMPKVIVEDDVSGLEMTEFNFKAYPSTENKRHWGYIITDPKKHNDIKEIYCSCKDYAYRLFRPYERAGMLKEKLIPPKFKQHAAVIPTKAWTKKTNPTGRLFLCKHLLALMKYI